MLTARYRLIWLWLSQVARSLADYCLRTFVLLQVSQFKLDKGSLWLQATTCFLAPFILLAPVNGALSNSLPKRWLLVGASAWCLCMTAIFGAAAGVPGDLWLWCIGLGLVGIGSAVYRSAYYAILPAAAQDARLPLNRVMGCMEAGDAFAAVAGLLLGISLHKVSWPRAMAALGWESTLASRMGHGQFPVPVAVALGFDLVAMFSAIPVHFSSAVSRPEPPLQAIAGFFRDSKVILKDAAARGSLLGLTYFLGLIAAGSFFESEWIVAQVGLAGGCLLAAVQGHPRRMLGLVPPAALGLMVILVCTAAGSNSTWLFLLLGLVGGLIRVPLRTIYQLTTPSNLRGNGMALMNAVHSLSILAPAPLLYKMTWLNSTAPFWLLVLLAAVGALLAWRVLLRETIEQLGEVLLWPMYGIRVRGPGRFEVPLRGPLLVIANHTAWFDPLWLAKVLPRRLTPMMTSRFFDLPILHGLMRNVAGAIRVPVAAFRREAPELQEAIAVLDRGGCVLIFPEGSMKRRPEQSLRHFGQGVWRILRQRPDTPVVVCWIEGGWGSYTSYCGGPPAVKKSLDWRRRIEIAMESPQRLDPALLANHLATRNHLMRACLNARRYLGLQPLPLQPASIEQAENNGPDDPEER